MKINKKLLMAALASAVIVSAPQAKTYADTQIDNTKAVTEKLIDNQLTKAAQFADQKNSEKAQAENTADADEKQKQQESSELKEEKEINSKKTGFGSQALNHPAQATAVSNVENEADNSGLEMSEQNQPEAQKAQEEVNEPNYTDEEKKVGNYRESQMEPGQVDENGNLVSGGPTHTETKNPEMDFKDGVRYKTLEPGADSPDKKKFGIEIEIDKEKGQRTYTEIGFSNSGNIGDVLGTGNNPANKEGKKLVDGFKDPSYKAEADLEITASRSQRNLNLNATEEDLKHINSKDNPNTTMAWEGKYTKDNANGLKATQGDSANFYFTVNPWPNENDKLQLIKLEGEYKDKVFVQGQEVDTGIKVENLDDNAKERLVGQVYNPNTGKVVPGASAYIDENGIVKVKMPKGALKQDASGKYVVDEDSIFNTADYKGIQHLDVRFFARPRTKAEFENVASKNNEFTNGDAKYTETGAGTVNINHKGTNVTIDKQGIDRYDHYNLIGKFNLNLDDTRHYDQDFKDQQGNKLDEHTSTKVIPGEDFSVEIQDPAETGGTKKTGAEMDGAYSRGEASGKLKAEFLDIANKQIAADLGVDYKEFITSDEYADKRWVIDGKSDNISKFTIRAPKQAKAGDFLALPVEYTYTNGSTDTHWFHFVVQETSNNRPEYLAEVGPQGNTLVNNPIITKSEEDLKKNQPESYELIGNTFKDNKGNVWNVSIDQTTGAVTATLPLGKEINGGEKLTVPVRVKYTDETTGKEKTEEIKAQFIATKRFKTQTSEKLTSEIPFETKVEYDPNLPEGYFQEFQAGQNGELTTTFIQDTLNGKKGLFQTDGTFIEGDRKIESTVTREATPRIIKIGTMPSSTTIEIPFDTEYEPDDTLAAGETKIVNEGEKGEVTITTSREEEGTVKINKETTKEAKNKKIKIGTKTQGQIVDTDKIPFKYKVEFDKDFYKNYPDATENYKIVTPGKEGENTKTWTIVNSEKVGEPTIEIKDPVDAVIKVGQKDYNGTVTNTVTKEIPYTVKVVKNPELEAGKSNVKQKGVAGSRTYEYTGEIINGDLKEGSTFTEKELTDKYVEPKEEIIEIGTKPAENSKTINSDVEVDVNIIYDPSVDKGVVNIGDLKPGTVTTVVKNEYDPETGEIKTTEETVVTKPSRTVVIGTKDFSSSYTEVDNKITPYKTEIQFDDTKKAGEQETVQIGVDGVVTTETEVTIVNGVPKKGNPKVTYSHDVQNQIIKVGTMTEGKHSHEEKIPFKYEIEYDSKLKAGEYVVDVEGKEGSRTTEWTIKNSEVVEGSANVTKEEAPTNAKIRVGNKDFVGNISHEVTEEIPYDVKIVEDPTMIAGTSKVVTEGKAGSKTTKYTQAIKNGEAEGKIQSEVTAETNPTQQVIRIGTKPAENNKDYSKEVGVKVEYVYDSSLKMGVFKDGGLTPGKVVTKIVNKYDPATGKITTTEEEKVTEAVQKIIVGTQDFTGKYPYESTTEIPFKVIVKEDPNLAKGQSRVEQEGKAGSKTTYYEIAIKNGEKVGPPIIIKEVENDQPLDHIIYVGTAVAKSSTVETVEKDIPYETKITYDENLDAGSQVVDKEGVVGKEKVTVTTNITDGNGETSKTTETITEKEDREVRIGVKPVTKVVEKPFNTEYVYDENLEAGQTEEVTTGKNGKVTITTTYNKETGKVETSETEEAGQNRVVKIGGKTNGTHTYKNKKPFEVEIKVNPELKKGEHKVIQKGVEGEEEFTVTIENSKVIKTSESKETKAPVNEIIEVGSEDYTGEVKHKEHFEIPFEVEVRYNDQLPAGTSREIQKGVQGSYDIEFNQKIKNGAPDGDLLKVESNKVEAKKHIIEVGTKVETPENNYSKDVEVEIEYVYDDTKDKGVVETGELTPGKVETKVVDKYNTETGKIEQTTEQVVTKAKQKVIVGTKDFTGKYEYSKTCPIPFEVEIIEDETLEKGKSVVDQEGVPGSKTTKYEQDIKNGQAVGEARKISEETTTEPVKHIVRVGTKPADPTEGETNKKIERDIPFDTKVIYDENLEAGSQVIEKEGKLGKEEVTITQKVKDSKPVGDPTETTKTITEKEDRVVRIGVKPVVKEVELGHDTEYRYNPNLPAGETKVIEEGSNGSVKYTTTFNKETGKLEVKEERTEPKNKIVEYGSKTDGEFKFESEQAYDIIIRENPDLEAGKVNVIQEGIVGKTETTVKIENSKEVSRDTKTITEKQDKIIEIGIKNVCEIPPVDPDPEKPGEEDPKDPEKPGDKDPEKPDKPGNKDPKDPDQPG
ncbi:MAG: G5 domain-containing protein, partial [Finegoldia magna]|uniref:G5 domain-containing protein n=1 Tax=Finegoldia magna TaxID=1260 RepID=UPI0029028C16